ncbi:MAG: hypothetical protein IKI64_10335 [Clostridia bacterium]|nr:hypothetical protein [Clostridia bacterium]
MNKGYGFDRLSRDGLILSTLLCVVGVMLWHSAAGMILCAIAALLMALILFRALSENVDRRRAELIGYESIVRSVSGFLGGAFSKLFNRAGQASTAKIKRDPGYRYFKCPGCGKEYRAPKGKGKIRVTCRECGVQFDKKV